MGTKKNSALPKSKAKTAYGLLTEIRALILAEPLRYNQYDWLSRKAEHHFVPNGYPACGTVGCVAGWVSTLAGPEKFSWDISADLAEKILGLDLAQAEELFRSSAASGPSQTLAHAKSGAKHIAAFQKKYRAQLLAKKLTPKSRTEA